MDVLIVEPLEPEVMHWLVARHAVRYAPDLARDPRAFRQALFNVRAMIIPPSVAVDAQVLHYAPVLRAVGRLSSGAENIDTDACARAGVEVVRPIAPTRRQAEFMIGALLQILGACRCSAPKVCLWAASWVAPRWPGGRHRPRGRQLLGAFDRAWAATTGRPCVGWAAGRWKSSRWACAS
jgi:hypothetical protein